MRDLRRGCTRDHVPPHSLALVPPRNGTGPGAHCAETSGRGILTIGGCLSVADLDAVRGHMCVSPGLGSALIRVGTANLLARMRAA